MSESSQLKQILSALDYSGVIYALVGEDTQALLQRVSGDVDIVVRQSDLLRLHNTLAKISSDLNIQIVQVLQHEICAYYYVVSWVEQGTRFYLRLDVCSDYIRDDRKLLSAQEMLEGRTCDVKDSFYLPSPKINFTYYLLKKIDKGSINQLQFSFLANLFRNTEKTAKHQIERFWNRVDTDRILRCLIDTDFKTFLNCTPRWKKSLRKNIPHPFIFSFKEVCRITRRVFHPTGLWIAIYGPDGCGKSAVISHLKPGLLPAFRRTAEFHFRPSVGQPKKDEVVTVPDPHGQPSRHPVMSVLKLFYYAMDYILGYLIRVVPSRMRSTFIINDRYYDDLLVDQKRYRYNGPVWLLKAVRLLIPKPDLVFCLDAPAEVLQARKQEVSFDVSAKQREIYRQMVSVLPNGHVIDADQPIEKVVFDVESTILSFLAKRTEKRMPKTRK